MQIMRIMAIVLLWPLALGTAAIALWPADTESARYSLAKQQDILADMQKMGDFTEQIRREEGRLATSEELLSWMGSQEFRSQSFARYDHQGRGDDGGIMLSVVPVEEEFIVGENSELVEDDGHTYRIAFWNNWNHEYAPETGQHTFPTSVEDYSPRLWERAIYFLMFIGFAALIVHMNRGFQRQRKARRT